MRNKVKSITEKVPQVTTLPDGFYNDFIAIQLRQ